MKIDNIDLYSGSNLLQNFSFKDPNSENPYQVKGITGLDADEITPKFAGRTVLGRTRYSMSIKKRQPVILMGLNPNYTTGETASGLRDRLFRAISASRSGVIDLKLNNGSTVVAVVSGPMVKLETSLFSDTPEVQLTFDCPDTMLKAPEDTVIASPTLSSEGDLTIVDDLSTAFHGFELVGTFTGPSSVFQITEGTYPNDDYLNFKVDPLYLNPVQQPGVSGFISGDTFHLSTSVGARALYVSRGTRDYQLVDKLSYDSVWPLMYPGSNTFKIIASNFVLNEVRYRNTYWGV